MTELRRGVGRGRGAVAQPWAWGVLLVLLVANLVGAVTFDRASWPGMVGDEATYAMQAQSLAWDLDLAYDRGDYDRFVEIWGQPPDGLILQSGDDGRHITYSKPFLYALVIAPFVRLMPLTGAAVANALLLALAALAAASTLERRVGPWAPLLVAALVFASAAFAYTYWIHADLFLMVVIALAFALAYRGQGDRADLSDRYAQIYGGAFGERRPLWRWGRWLAVGCLLGAAVAFRPFYGALVVPALLAIPRERSGRRSWGAMAALLGGLVLVVALSSLASWSAGGSWSSYGGERQGFYARTGFPGVDFPADRWPQSVRQWGNTSWIHEGSLDFEVDGSLWAWNGVYFLVGRSVGVLPYFLPLLLLFLFARGDGGRWALVPAVLVVVACFFLVRPFNFYGGGGAIANRYFLPVYPALWFLAARPLRPGWVLAVVTLAAPFVYPLWLGPRAFPGESPEGAGYRHTSRIAQRMLPYESTQSHIPGGRDVNHQGLWIKFLNRNAEPVGEGRELRLSSDGPADLVVGSAVPLDGVVLTLGAGAPGQLAVQGGVPGSTVLTPDGGISFQVELDEPWRRHPMWWTWDDVYLYRLRPSFPDADPGESYSLRIRPLTGGGAPPEERPAGAPSSGSPPDDSQITPPNPSGAPRE